MENLIKKLNEIQVALKAPKNQYNSFGKYKYRSCEDILEGLKPWMEKLKVSVYVSDDVEEKGNRIYIKATATITDGKESISVSAFAREPETQKGMNEAQITGSASSYARKYALNGLFCIDDTKDSDYSNNGQKEEAPKQAPKKETNTRVEDPENESDAKNIASQKMLVFNSFKIKDELKELGFRFNSDNKAWEAEVATKDFESFKRRFEEKGAKVQAGV